MSKRKAEEHDAFLPGVVIGPLNILQNVDNRALNSSL